MSDHRIVIRADDLGDLRGDCSCGDRIIYAVTAVIGLSLDKINQWAHEHIEAAERGVREYAPQPQRQG